MEGRKGPIDSANRYPDRSRLLSSRGDTPLRVERDSSAGVIALLSQSFSSSSSSSLSFPRKEIENDDDDEDENDWGAREQEELLFTFPSGE